MAIKEATIALIKTIDGQTSVAVSFDGSVQSAALTEGVHDLCATQDCYIKTGTNPTAAAATSYLLPAGVIVRFFITGAYKVAAIKVTAAGILQISPIDELD